MEALRTHSCKVGHGVRPSGDPFQSHNVSKCLHHRSFEGLKEEQEKKVKVDEQETKGEKEKFKEPLVKRT